MNSKTVIYCIAFAVVAVLAVVQLTDGKQLVRRDDSAAAKTSSSTDDVTSSKDTTEMLQKLFEPLKNAYNNLTEHVNNSEFLQNIRDNFHKLSESVEKAFKPSEDAAKTPKQ